MGLRGESDPSVSPAAEGMVAPGAVSALIARLAHAPTEEAPPLLVPGARVGRYEIIRAIGRGGFGTVYEAHDTALNRLVALKVLHSAGAEDTSAASEAEVAARLAHPNIAALHDVGMIDGGFAYLVYEILHGETLESRLARGRMPPAEAIAIARQVAHALSYAHARGVVHRDLKPANVFLTAEGDVKVLDFGIALLFGARASAGGTPAYMAPEQRRGDPEDARTDLYALGLLLRDMLDPQREGVIDRVPPPIRRVLAALTAEDPGARPRSARAAIAVLEAARRSLPMVRRHRFMIATIVLLVLAIASAVLVRDRVRPGATASGASVPSIAVLPFVDMSPQHDQEFFSDGVAEEILNALVRVEGLRVAGRSSSFAYKGTNKSAAEIGHALHVVAVLEGSVRKAGQRVRIAAELVSTADGFDLWSQSYERGVADVFGVQDEIARSVAAALEVKLLPGSASSAREHLATDPDAYSQYLLARQLFHLGSGEGYRRAVDAYEKALAIDPRYAPAWAGLAVAASYASNFAHSGEEFLHLVRRSREAGPRAVEFDPGLADGFAARGYARALLDHDWAGADEDMRRAIALSPRDAEIRRLRTLVLLPVGRTTDAAETSRLATELDPGSSLSWNSYGFALMAWGQYAAARAPFEEALRLSPDQSFAALNLVTTLLMQGDAARALPIAENIISPSRRLAGVAEVHHALGRERESRAALEALVAEYADRAPFEIAVVYAWRGERDPAFEWLERAAAASDRELPIALKGHPLLRGLRDDPRYAVLLRKLNLPGD